VKVIGDIGVLSRILSCRRVVLHPSGVHAGRRFFSHLWSRRTMWGAVPSARASSTASAPSRRWPRGTKFLSLALPHPRV